MSSNSSAALEKKLRERESERHLSRRPSLWLGPPPSATFQTPLPPAAAAPVAAAEMSVWNYVVTAHKPTSVSHSCVGNFTSPNQLNLIIA